MYCTDILLLLAGLSLISTYDDLSYDKVANQSHTYLALSTGASNAVDGNTGTCMKPYGIGLNSDYKTVWWKVDFGDVYIVYSITILFKWYDGYENRQRGRFAGFSLYISTTGDIKGSTLCYTDGPQLPLLNFTTTCIEHGRYLIFYNERIDGVTYPKDYQLTNVFNELCEVVVLGCKKPGVYGINCDISCSINCKDNLCNIENGTCFGCKPGWRDTLCDKECKEGWYGVICNEQCSGHCRDNYTCNHVIGQCDGGCDKGWTGSLCDKECVDGTYGYNCINNCSGHCLNNSPCNKQTGHCDRGCKPGFTYGDCSKECPSQYYGMNCIERCSGHCINNESCDHVKGKCTHGCKDGYIGARCDDACNEGYFGTNCSQMCSPNCKHDTCRYTDGSCTSCSAGWMGHNCTTECMLFYGENCQYQCSAHCINQTCDRINGSCLYRCKDGQHCEEETAKLSYSTTSDFLPIYIGGILVACVIVVFGVVIAIFFERRKSSNTKCNTDALWFFGNPRLLQNKEPLLKTFQTIKSWTYP